jgi:GNAT superfamily N-acetyltransferase
MSLFTLRPAREEDLETLVEFNAAMAAETESLQLERERLRAGVAALLADPGRGRYRAAEADGQIVGALMLTLEWSDWRCGYWWWIQSVYVRPDWRRRGVFAALYRSVEAEAQSDPEVCGLRLYVEHENVSAQNTYAALGMAETHYRMFEVSTRG